MADLIVLYDDELQRRGRSPHTGARPCNLSDADDGWCYDHKSYDCPRLANELPRGCWGYHRDRQCLVDYQIITGDVVHSIDAAHHHHDQRCLVNGSQNDCVFEGCARAAMTHPTGRDVGLCPEHEADRNIFHPGAIYTIHGRQFQIDEKVEFGSFYFSDKSGAWMGSPHTINVFQDYDGNKRLAQVKSMETGRTGGITVARAVVKENLRRPPSTSYAVADLSPLVTRAHHLVVQIASRDDWPPGQRDQLLKSYAAIVDELLGVKDQMDEIEGHLSVIRGQLMHSAMSE